MCAHNKNQYFYSVYTNKRICKHCWTEEQEQEEDSLDASPEETNKCVRYDVEPWGKSDQNCLSSESVTL
jgi:hypothetical protein